MRLTGISLLRPPGQDILMLPAGKPLEWSKNLAKVRDDGKIRTSLVKNALAAADQDFDPKKIRTDFIKKLQDEVEERES